MIAALNRLKSLEAMIVPMPAAIRAAISAARSISEAVSGAGESEVLQRVTVNIGTVAGGQAVNLVPDRAAARCDLRFPPGLSVANIEQAFVERLTNLEGVAWRVLSATAPNVTDPGHELVALAQGNAAAVLGRSVAANMRVGFSDARFYRHAGIPAVVFGPTPHGMGGPDEQVTLADLDAVVKVHALIA